MPDNAPTAIRARPEGSSAGISLLPDHLLITHPQSFRSAYNPHILSILMLRYKTDMRVDMAALLAQLTSSEKSDPGVHHALQVHASLATSNYVRFFRLYNSAPNMSGYIMDHFVERERMTSLTIMSKSYVRSRPSPLSSTRVNLPCQGQRC